MYTTISGWRSQEGRRKEIGSRKYTMTDLRPVFNEHKYTSVSRMMETLSDIFWIHSIVSQELQYHDISFFHFQHSTPHEAI